jgi:hypothetical protein
LFTFLELGSSRYGIRWIPLLVGLAFVTLERSASAQTTEPTPSYTVDAAQGPVTGSTRVIGLGGAFVAVAEDMDGVAVNPASVAVRLPHSWNRWEFGLGFDFAIGGWLPESDFLNRAPPEEEQQEQDGADVEERSLLFGSVGFTLQFEHAGLGISAEGQQQALQRSEDTSAGLAPADLAGNFGVVHANIGYGFFDGQFALGAGPRVTGVSLTRGSGASDILSINGIGYQVGAIYKPLNSGLRVGAAYKSEVRPSFDASVGPREQPVYNTTALRLPWQVSAGFAYQFGARPFNPPLVTVEDRSRAFLYNLELDAVARERQLEEAERTYEAEPTPENDERLARTKARFRREAERDEDRLAEYEQRMNDALLKEYLARPRFYLLVTTELLILGPTTDSIDLASVYENRSTVRFSGETLTLSPRLGLESEVAPNWLKLRAGTYLEPARVSGARDRLHGTFGFDVKLFRWNVFGLIGDFDSWLFSAAVDRARDYISTSFSIGLWH